MISVNERNLTSENWTVYNEATKRLQYSTAPTSAITAETVMVSGFALMQEVAGEIIGYQANALNQYAMLSVDDIADFIPSYDAENRPTDFTSQAVDGTITTVHCEYDYMGRRATKQVTTNGSITLHQRYIYRGYLQIAALDLTRAAHPALWYITWDPTQPIQWSSEFNDTEQVLVYYNYRRYNPMDGRWTGRDFVPDKQMSEYAFLGNAPFRAFDYLVLKKQTIFSGITRKISATGIIVK